MQLHLYILDFLKAAVLLGLTVNLALAQTESWVSAEPHDPQDYYNSSPGTRELLNNVEKYHLQQGISAMREGRNYFAWQHFDFILRYFPNHPRGLQLMGELTVQIKSPPKGQLYFDRALRLFPNSTSNYAAYGIFLQKQGKLDLAIEQYKKAVELSPESASYNYNLGLAYFDKKQFALANEHAQKAYALGFPLPGLRNKLTQANAWKPLESNPEVETKKKDGAVQAEKIDKADKVKKIESTEAASAKAP